MLSVVVFNKWTCFRYWYNLKFGDNFVFYIVSFFCLFDHIGFIPDDNDLLFLDDSCLCFRSLPTCRNHLFFFLSLDNTDLLFFFDGSNFSSFFVDTDFFFTNLAVPTSHLLLLIPTSSSWPWRYKPICFSWRFWFILSRRRQLNYFSFHDTDLFFAGDMDLFHLFLCFKTSEVYFRDDASIISKTP